MKKQRYTVLLTLIFAVALPQLFLALSAREHGETALPQETTKPVLQEMVNVLLDDGEVCIMDGQTYLTGVLLQEMPASFSLDAKKAQAVVARTYALRQCGTDKHNGAVCTESACCQAYISIDEYLKAGGSEEAVAQAKQAVAETAGQVLTYEGSLIDATYFSCSGGRTEDAVAVWGADIPYLRSVESPGEEGAAHFVDTKIFSEREFMDVLELEGEHLTAADFGETEYTAGGGVASMEIRGRKFTGVQLRMLLELRSTSFTVTAVGSSIAVTTRGFGHRVGMSQYGAEAMAVSGSGYAQILAHYYIDTELTVLE